MTKPSLSHLKRYSRTLLHITAGLLIIASAVLPAVLTRGAGAAQLTSRSLTIDSGIPSATGRIWTYGFTYVTSASAIQSVKFVVCTTATGTYGLASTASTSGCSAPATGNLVNQGAQSGTLGGSWTNTTAFSRDAVGAGNCTPGNNVLCIKRTQAAAESAAAKTIAWDTQTNPSSTNTAFFVGVYLYSDTGWATPTDSGTVASATVQTLTVNAQVAEILNFCVGSTTIDDATSTVGASCGNVSGTSVNLGTLDPSKVSITPETTNCSPADCTKNGVAMLRTNAANGATVSYDSIQQSGTAHLGTLRIAGNNCTTDPNSCFTANTTQGTFSAASQKFGMTVAGVNCGSSASYGSCTGTASNNLVRAGNYDGDGTGTYITTDLDQINGPTTNGYAWDETGTMTQIASSTASSTKQVDDEALILKFAASPSPTATFGSYTALADFVAVATY